MNQSRRKFIRNSSLTSIGALLLQQNLFASTKKGELTGIQLYSIRTEMKADPLGTLKQLSKIILRALFHFAKLAFKVPGFLVSENK